jgi:hypothetical protein
LTPATGAFALLLSVTTATSDVEYAFVLGADCGDPALTAIVSGVAATAVPANGPATSAATMAIAAARAPSARMARESVRRRMKEEANRTAKPPALD